MKIRTSMFRMVGLLIAIPFFLFSLISSRIYTDKLEKIITESLQAVANVQIAEMTRFCQEQMDNLTIIGGMDVSHAALRGELDQSTLEYLNNMLYSHVETTGYLKNSALIDVHHRVVACSEDHWEEMASAGMDRLIERMKNKPFYISDVLSSIGEDGKEYKSVVAIARIEHADQLLGYALAEINLDFYDAIRRQADLWQESTFYLLDGAQQIISAGTNMENRDAFITTAKEREDYNNQYDSIDFRKNPNGNFSYQLEGKTYITYYSIVQYTNWRFLLTINMDNYLAKQNIYCLLAGMLVLLCTALALWIGSFTSKRIIRPIKHISDTLREIQEDQDYSLRIDVERNDELGSLSAEINGLLSFIETEDLHKTKQQRLLQQKAERDPLTKVLNKEHITTYVQKAIERHWSDQTGMAVLFVDVDDFKFFNTNHGHDVGDQVLLFTASLLAKETKGTIGRVGGDEFLAVVESPERLRELDLCLERINQLLRTQFVIRTTGEALPISCCIGAIRVDVSAVKEKATAEALIKQADDAMYRVKNNGKHASIILNYE